MDRKQVLSYIGEVCAYFERKPPSPLTMDIWFEKLGSIPSEAIGYIKQAVISKAEWPKNLPMLTWALYSTWLQHHPEKKARQESTACPRCIGGVIPVGQYLEIYRAWIETSVNCGHCKQREHEPNVPMMTDFEIQQAGFKPWNRDLSTPTAVNPALFESIRSIKSEARVREDDGITNTMQQFVSQIKTKPTTEEQIPF